MPTFLAIILHKWFMCVAQFRCSSIIIPRNLVLFTGCVLAPTLFSMVFVLCHASRCFKHNDDGTRYRTDGRVFNLRRLTAKTKVRLTTLRELIFADDCALNSNTEAEMQQSVNHFSRDCDNFDFTISSKKTEVMHQPGPLKMYNDRATHLCELGATKSYRLCHLPGKHPL